MKFFKKKETVADTNTLFEFDKSEGCYVAEVNGIRFECYEVDEEIEMVPSMKSGNKQLVDVDVLEKYVADITSGAISDNAS